MLFRFGYAIDIGRVKSVNQDKLLVSVIDSPQGKATALFAVADGMGGTEGGEEASAIAIARIEQWHKSIDLDRLVLGGSKDITNSLKRCFIIINELILNYGRENGISLGTTLSVALVIDRSFFIAHTGDSRIYLRRSKEVTQLTLDHSFVAEQVKRGLLTKDEAEKDNRRNILTQCLGITEETTIFTKNGKLKSNDILILCSDGLYRYIKPENISGNDWQSAQDSAELQNLADQMVTEANEKGGKDNISVILTKVIGRESWLSKIGIR